MKDVVIIGGGIIGLMSALELRQRGLSVEIIDAGRQRPCASWAGGGILSPLHPWRYPDAVNRLCRNAVADYQALSALILDAGGPDPEVSRTGMLVASEEGPEKIRRWAARLGVAVLEGDPGMTGPGSLRGRPWWMPEVGSVRNPRLLQGLEKLLAARKVSLQRAFARDIRLAGDGVEVCCGAAVTRARRAVICAGWWSAPLLEPLGLHETVFPAKGEMLLYRAPADAPGWIVLSEEGYLIPRADGLMLVGSTLEPGNSDLRPSAAAGRTLQRLAGALCPSLAGVEPLAQWAGIRPGTGRQAPLIDMVERTGRLWVNTGHYRNGLVAAPASARLLAQRMCGEAPELDPGPYSVSSPGSSDSF